MNRFQKEELEQDMVEQHEEEGLDVPEPGTKAWNRAVRNTAINIAAYDSRWRQPKRE